MTGLLFSFSSTRTFRTAFGTAQYCVVYSGAVPFRKTSPTVLSFGVKARRDTVGRALFDDGSAQDRHPGLVDNYAFYLITSVLRQREGGGKLTYEQDTRTHS